MPVAIGRISDSHNDTDSLVWTFGDAVREAQARFVAEDGNAALVTSTDNYGYSDKWHYDSEGYIDLGREFAEAIAGLRRR
jgi:iduronate 2-sulfatase